MNVLCFAAGLLVGELVGVAAVCCCVAAGRADREMLGLCDSEEHLQAPMAPGPHRDISCREWGEPWTQQEP